MTGFPKAVRDLIAHRSGGMCERCGVNRAVQIHHRRPRGIGGSRRPETNQAANGLHLCNGCHAVTESDRDEGLRHGWLVRQGRDPKVVPVFRMGQWVQLNNDGTITTKGEPRDTV